MELKIPNWYMWIIIVSILLLIYSTFFENKTKSKDKYSEEETYHQIYEDRGDPNDIYAP